jgi:hypothetical protein
MIIQCAWCLKMVGEKAPLSDRSVTHGICKECQQKMMKQAGMMELKK